MKLKSKKTDARERIMNKTLELFYNQGYLATGINQIISESGVSKNTFYYHFPSKEKLCIEYLRARHSIWSCWLKDRINEFNTPEERFLSPFDFLETWMKDCNFRGCAFLNIASEVPDLNTNIRREVIYHKNSLKYLLFELTKELKQSDKKYKNISVDTVGKYYYVIFEGAIVASQNYGEIWPIQAARENIKIIMNL